MPHRYFFINTRNGGRHIFEDNQIVSGNAPG
jgi:hypothetical protein